MSVPLIIWDAVYQDLNPDMINFVKMVGIIN